MLPEKNGGGGGEAGEGYRWRKNNHVGPPISTVGQDWLCRAGPNPVKRLHSIEEKRGVPRTWRGGGTSSLDFLVDSLRFEDLLVYCL